MQSRLLPLAALALAGVAYAHGGHEAVPEGSTTSEEPIVRVLFCSVPDLGPADFTVQRTPRYGCI